LVWDRDYLLFSKLFSLLLDFPFFMASTISRGGKFAGGNLISFVSSESPMHNISFYHLLPFSFQWYNKAMPLTCFRCLIDGITGFQLCRMTCSTEFIIGVFLVSVPVSSFHFWSLVILLYYSSQLKYLEDISSVIDEKYYLCVLVF
jgi:hypothetical protein